LGAQILFADLFTDLFAYLFTDLLPTFLLLIASTEVAVVASFIKFAVQITDQNDEI